MNKFDTKNFSGKEKLGVLFHQAVRLMQRGKHHHGGVHHAQGRVLRILKERGSLGQRELLEILDVRSGSLSELVAKLENHELIARSRDEEDKRGFIISLTEKGKAAVAEHEEGRKKMMESLFAPLSPEESEKLEEILTKLVSAWNSERESGHGHGEEGGRGKHGGHGRHRHGHSGEHRDSRSEDESETE